MIIKILYLGASLLIAAANTPHSFTIIDYWQKKCGEGDRNACSKIENSKLAEQKLEKLNELAVAFQNSIDPADFLLDKKPDLGKAYPIVIQSYLESFQLDGASVGDKYAIDYCAQHFHNYWLKKKFWWPTDAEDKPDWRTIYIYIVDHYHGICLNRAF